MYSVVDKLFVERLIVVWRLCNYLGGIQAQLRVSYDPIFYKRILSQSNAASVYEYLLYYYCISSIVPCPYIMFDI